LSFHVGEEGDEWNQPMQSSVVLSDSYSQRPRHGSIHSVILNDC
jgi:hypothetical protein